ncbi:NADPH-dependent FMN reductase [Lentzea sp. NPDC054927]
MTPIRLAVLIGSTRTGRLSPTVAGWFARQAVPRADLDVDVIDLADGEVTSARIAAADAFVVVTPEYNHSFPGVLKTEIDRHLTEWQAKPVGFVSHGGVGGGLRAVEQLRLVFAELHAVTVRDTVSFHNGLACFDADGEPVEPAGCGAAAKTMLDELVWWALALRAARTARPYAM